MLLRLAYPLALPLTAALLLGACGDDGGGDTENASEAAASTGESGTSDDTPTSSPTSGDATSGDTPTSSDSDPSTGGDSDSDGTTGDEPSPYVGDPLPSADDGEWIWVDFPEAKCRDGSGAGIGVRYGSGPGLVIFFEGGGACFNAFTCGVNPANFDGANFQGSSSGIFDPSSIENPVADWSFIYVPYCTGDVHAGAAVDGTLPDVGGKQQFVGYLNVGHFLQRVVPTFLGQVDQVLTTGVSAGGFGAAFNYDRIADAFPKVPVTLLDDSGPPMSDMYMATCLQKKWRDSWNLDASIPKECTDCFPADGGGIVNLGVYLGKKHSKQRLGLISSLGDNTIRLFFGFGNDNCTALIPTTPVETYTAGLHDLRDNWLNEPAGTWGSFFLDGEQHTWIGGASYYSANSGGTRLLDWISDLIAGTTSNVEP
ncbi:MAG: hypothetical protein IPO88_20915 [Nannocystis sp.]|uniref:pectin acetylesterase-family hydrolase n=1 Tax=Nannocystis sp. TaxID=1962667 RepID=UPI002428E457|nr:pectin acetylesterase-family hydrolase [Nannocystis sp.]MBK9755914.1 hypothetical protein [Nannocystis sp.]